MEISYKRHIIIQTIHIKHTIHNIHIIHIINIIHTSYRHGDT